MLYLIEDQCMMKATTRNYTFYTPIRILGDIYPIDAYVYVYFVPGLRKQDGTSARGGYGHLKNDDGYIRGIIFLNEDCIWEEAVSVLIHEYAHHLSQQNHGFLMYELWREYLRQEFKRRYESYARGEENTGDDRGRVIVVGEVCDHGTCQHLQERHCGCGQEGTPNECPSRGSGRDSE